jgi:hypothetical protein
MDRRYSYAILLAVLLACLQISGCGGGSGTKPLIVSTTPLPNGIVGVAYGGILRASGGTAPYVWSQTSGGDMPPGVTLGSSGSFAGTPSKPGTYGPYVFLATDSVGDTATSPGLSITITASTITIGTASLPNGLVGTAYSASLSATGGAPPYSWTETSGGDLPPGLSLSGSVISGTPTTVGNYGPYVFDVTDTSSGSASTGNLTITVNSASAVCSPSGGEALLTTATPYTFLLKGTDRNSNPIDIAGSFTPNASGGISSAIVDYNGFTNGPEPLEVNLAASSYSFNSSSAQGCLYLAFSGLSSGASIKSAQVDRSSQLKAAIVGRPRTASKPQTAAIPVASVQFSFYLSSFDGTIYHTGRIIESDNANGKGTNASGGMYFQNTPAFALSSLAANFAFGVDGWTAAAPSILRTAIAGAFSNSSGNLSSGYADMDLGGSASGELTGGNGTFNSTIDDNGRGTGSYFLSTPNGNLTFDFAFYVINGSDLLLLSTDLASSDSTTPLLSGRALASSASFPTAALNGNYVLASEGLQTIGTAIGNIAELGTLNATNAGAIPTATVYSNYAGTPATNQYPGSSYTVEAASGRVSITGLTSFPPVAYLTAGASSDDEIVGFLVGTDPQSSSGVLVNQATTAPSFNVGSITGNYAASTEEDVDGSNGSFLGGFVFNGTGAYTVTSQVTGTVTSVPSLGAITVNSDGSGNLDGGAFPLVTNGNVIFAIPDSGDPLLFVFIAGTLP